MRKHYDRLHVTPLGIEPEGGFLAGSRPIEMQDVVVNDFENGNQKWVEDGGSANDFEITFE